MNLPLYDQEFITQLIESNKRLKKENEELRARLAELEEKLATNSKNSSKAPSQDPYRARKGKRKPSGKKQGAQPGHKGKARAMVPPEEVSEFKVILPVACGECGCDQFVEKPLFVEARQVTELPEIKPLITHYHIHTCRCSGCGASTKATVPKEAESAFGPRLKGFVTMLTGELGVTKRKTVRLIHYLNIPISLGSVCNIHHLAGKILKDPYERIRTHTLEQSAIHSDETSWYRKGVRKWLWVLTGKESAFFSINPSRSSLAFLSILGDSKPKAPLVCDRYSAYNAYTGPKQYCWSHLDRDFTKLIERGGVDEQIGRRLADEADQVFLYWRHYKAGLMTRGEMSLHVKIFIKPSVAALLNLGSFGQGCQPKTNGTCGNIVDRFDNLWTYLDHEGVDPTNNLAERDLRPSVIQRKLSYGCQSDDGEAFIERVLTVATTLGKQARNLLKYLEDCFEAHCRDGPIPSPI